MCSGGTCRQLEGSVAPKCFVDSDCKSDFIKLVCDEGSGVCLPCIVDDDCSPGVCIHAGVTGSEDKKPVFCAQCRSDADCVDTSLCDQAQFFCKTCKSDAQCGNGRTCKDGACHENLTEGPPHAQ